MNVEWLYKYEYWFRSADIKSAAILRDKLAEAMKRKDAKALEEAIEECEAARYPELSGDLQEARDMLESLGSGRGG